MSLSVRRFGQLIGATTVSGMAQKLGIEPRPLSVRDMILRFGLPLQPTHLRISWLEGNFPQHPVDHPPDSNNVPVQAATFEWDDPGKGSQRAATAWTFHIKSQGQEKTIGTVIPSVGMAFDFATVSSWNVVPENVFGQGLSSPVFSFKTETPPPPPPPPLPQTKTLTLQVSLSLPAFKQSITEAQWLISGPGAPQAPINSPVGGPISQVAVPLPTPQGSASYTVRSSVAFAYDGLVRNNGTSGPENSQVDLSQPTPLPWTGQSRVARFSITYDSFNNVFIMAFDGLFG
jgi:hypothetical protein